jgi:predicted NUDIX family NTP pyrophosphohydrolase
MYRRAGLGIEIFLVHPGGPFWAKKDAWTIPKGEYDDSEDAFDAACREFLEETSFLAEGPFLDLGEVKQPSGKLVRAWAFAGDCDPAQLRSNTCLVEWPPRSGREIEIPEVDRGQWFTPEIARERIFKGQEVLVDRLLRLLPGAE